MIWNKKGNIFNKHHSQLPVVDDYLKFYRIFYSTRIDGKSFPMYIDVDKNDPSIILNQGKVNVTWGDPGSFDWSGIMPTEIVNHNGLKYLYYIGWSRRLDVPYHNNLGLLISRDGENWSKYSDGPVFSTSYKEPGYIGTCNILIQDDTWKMWYLSCRNWIEYSEKMEPIYDIKYAESQNGIDWDPKNITCIPLLNYEGGISSSRVIKDNNKYLMWFSVRNKIDYRENVKNSYRIKMAESSNGIDWNRKDKIEIDISDDDWENVMVCYPFLIKNENNLIMFYNGNGFGKTGIGYTISNI